MNITAYLSGLGGRLKFLFEEVSSWARKKAQEISAVHLPTSGPDPNSLSPEEDRLDRYRVAEEIFRLLTDQPDDCSVRLGLIGEWGVGKTVIAKWVDQIASEKGHCVIWFNPWAATSVDRMWFELSRVLYGKLLERGIKLSAGRELAQLVRSVYYGYGIAHKTPRIKDYADIAERFLRLSPEDIKAIQDALGANRVIVIVDDIDRADTILIPKLLLAMRELFELPRFSFLIPFAKTKVVAALSSHNISGHDFLEKIFDYQVQVPPPTPEQKLVLFGEAIRAILPMMPRGIERELIDVLPDNPRRIKRTAQQLQVVKREIERHSPREIDWHSLLYAALLRSESDSFFERWVRAYFSEDRSYRVAHGLSAGERRKAIDASIEEALKGSDVSDAAQRQLRTLVERWHESCGQWFGRRTTYTLRLFERPHAVTRREFDDIFQLWKKQNDIIGVLKKLDEAISRTRFSRKRVVREFIDATVGHYFSLLEAAANTFRADAHGEVVREASAVLALSRALGIHSELDDGQRAYLFKNLVEVIVSWSHFRGNEADKRLREEEEDLLLALVRLSGENWIQYVEALEPRQPDLPANERFNEIVARLRPLFRDREVALLVSKMQQDSGLREIFRKDSLAGLGELFLDPTGCAWKPLETAPLPQVLATAGEAFAVQENVHWFLRTVHGRDYLRLGIDREKAEALLEDPDVAVRLWNAAVASPLQFRRLSETRSIREWLGGLGVDLANLKVPEWLDSDRCE